MTQASALRPAWTPLTIALMVLGFVFFWPLGLAMLAYILFGDRIPEFRRQAEGMKADLKRSFGGGCASRGSWNASSYRSGNAAFDDYRKSELKRLEAERRRLDEERAEFEAFVRNLRRARDQEEFDRFKTDRDRTRKAPPTGESDVIDL